MAQYIYKNNQLKRQSTNHKHSLLSMTPVITLSLAVLSNREIEVERSNCFKPLRALDAQN